MKEQAAQHAVETVVVGNSGKITAGGAATGTGMALTLSDWGIIIGIAVAILGLLVPVYFQWRKDRREELESKERMRMEKLEHAARMEEITQSRAVHGN